MARGLDGTTRKTINEGDRKRKIRLKNAFDTNVVERGNISTIQRSFPMVSKKIIESNGCFITSSADKRYHDQSQVDRMIGQW